MRQTVKNRFARVGLFSKGLVYVVVGVFAFMAAFEIGGQSETEANRSGVLQFFEDKGGVALLAAVALGLMCYCVWRYVQAFSRTDSEQKITKRLRYFFSGLAYSYISFSAVKMIIEGRKDNGDKNQETAADVMSQPYGAWLVGIGALIIAGIGLYQIYYGLSEKYKKHVQELKLHTRKASLLLTAGKTGYVARGVVWLLLSYLLGRAAWSHNSSEAGDTGKAFRLVEDVQMGSWFLGVIAAGVVAYGLFNFVRARYEHFR